MSPYNAGLAGIVSHSPACAMELKMLGFIKLMSYDFAEPGSYF